MNCIVIGLFLANSCLPIASAAASDWPTYRADAERSGYTPERLPTRLSPAWVWRGRHRPAPAWPTSTRMTFDHAAQPVVAGGAVFFGSSADGRVYCLDAASGALRWSVLVEGPVRLAPAFWQDRVFVASDDGHLYCLSAADGRVLWKHRGAPGPDMLLGNDRMISRWPARGGPVVSDNIVYYSAGIWPSEGFFLYALDAGTGHLLWCNDSAGGMEMDQPHGGARAKSGVIAQGHLAVSGEALLVSTGRAVPAVFDRSKGAFRYFHLQANTKVGAAELAVIGDRFFNGGSGFLLADGLKPYALGSPVAAHPDYIVYATTKTLAGADRRKPLAERTVPDRRGKPTRQVFANKPAWSVELPCGRAAALIVAGDEAVVGGEDAVAVCDARSGSTRWQTDVEGTAYGLAVAGARLYVSTDAGLLCCFGDTRSRAPRKVGPPVRSAPRPGDAYAAAAKEILRRTGIGEGYCLDLGCGDGSLTLALAQQSKLYVCAVDDDPSRVQTAREKLEAAGLYGVRATVHQADPATIPFADSFADLIVSGRAVADGSVPGGRDAWARFQRPYGGVACLGRPDAMQIGVRGPLEGVGTWSHQYADAANTLCSGDTRLRGPLAMLWFRDTDLVMPNRHGRGPAPLVQDGRMFAEGIDALRATSIYNGRTLWEVPLKGVRKPFHQEHLMGAAGTGSNICLSPDALYVAVGGRCLRIDPATGKQLGQAEVPRRADGKPGTWGYLAYSEGTLFGSRANERHLVTARFSSGDMSRQFTESDLLFAMDPTSGRLKWSYTPKHSIRHNALAVGGGRVYLIDRPIAHADTFPRPAKGQKTPPRPEQPLGRLLAMDAESGQIVWQTEQDVFGTMLALSTEHDVLLVAYQSTRFQLDSELGGRMAALRAGDGKPLWDVKAKYESRPILNGRTIYAQPGAWDLLSGEELPFVFKRSYGCGIPVASARLLVFRSATVGYCDVTGDGRVENYGGIRPGCWVNAIPAGGLVLLADAASWCTCSYLNQATVALMPAAGPGP